MNIHSDVREIDLDVPGDDYAPVKNHRGHVGGPTFLADRARVQISDGAQLTRVILDGSVVTSKGARHATLSGHWEWTAAGRPGACAQSWPPADAPAAAVDAVSYVAGHLGLVLSSSPDPALEG